MKHFLKTVLLPLVSQEFEDKSQWKKIDFVHISFIQEFGAVN